MLKTRINRLLPASLLIAVFQVDSAEISSANFTLDPTYDAAGCALVTSTNGYGGTDRQIFIPAQDGYYSVKDYSSVNTQWILTVEAFDPNQPLLDQALASSETEVEMPAQAYITAGTRTLVWSVYTGGYGTAAECQADGGTQTVTMRVVGEDSGVPEAPTNLVATAGDGGATIAFTAGSNNGSAISNYQYGTFNGMQWVYTSLNPADNSSPVTLTGSTNGVPASVRLKAINANGASTDSAAVGFTPEAAAVPAQPVPAIPGFLTWMLLSLTGWIGLLTLSRRRRT